MKLIQGIEYPEVTSGSGEGAVAQEKFIIILSIQKDIVFAEKIFYFNSDVVPRICDSLKGVCNEAEKRYDV